MAKRTLRAVTPVGTFTRVTETGYRFVTVWASPRAMDTARRAASGELGAHRGGKTAQWVKDQGYGVTWHFKNPGVPHSWRWDSAATLVGVFQVEAE